MNLSYSGSPEQYVDCGHLNLQDQKASGVQTQSFPPRRRSGILDVERRQDLQSEAENGARRTYEPDFRIAGQVADRVTANTKYVLTRDVQAIDGANVFKLPSDVIGFNTGGAAVFPTTDQNGRESGQPAIECRPTGALERSVLDLVQ